MELRIASKLEQTQFEQMIGATSEIRFMKHDIQNHLEAIKSLNSNSKSKEIDSYINSLIHSINNNYLIVSSGNVILDSIISNKLVLCKKENITTDYTLHFSDDCPLSATELCSLIGNIFDNAIEACKKIPVENRRIDFCIKPYKNMLSFTIENPTDGIYNIENGIIQTTKKESLAHGLGLKRIQSIVDTYNGFMEIKPDTNSFKVSIMIPLVTSSQNSIGDENSK